MDANQHVKNVKYIGWILEVIEIFESFVTAVAHTSINYLYSDSAKNFLIMSVS